MRSEESPSFENYSVFDQPTATDPEAKKRKVRQLIVLFLIVSLFLAVASLLQNRKVSTLFGTGSIQGQVLTSNGLPFQGEIYILGTALETQTAPDGTFVIQGVPGGEQVLIVADEQIGRNFPVQVIAGKQLDIGQIRFEATAVPSP